MVTVSLASIITGITYVFTVHIRCISTARSLYFKNFSASLFITLLSPTTALSIDRSFLIIMHYDARFIAMDGFVSLHLTIP